jgi:uroporphyrin-III C-methyltransferase
LIGKVYLVGAGPGDPDLVTVKGLRLLRAADVIIYDRLIPHDLLDEARPDAELIDGGKEPTRHRLSQETINQQLVEKAGQGALVVRLKGGDPFVFGRGGEEALACFRAGIPFEVVPGVSSAFSVPAYAGIPVTHRGITTTLTIIAGHEDPAVPGSGTDYEALARLGGTLVILMGVKHLKEVLDRLAGAGLPADTPAAVIEWGATPEQRVAEGTLVTLAAAVAEMDLQPPAITVIGEVVRLRAEGVRWFDELLTQAVPQR